MRRPLRRLADLPGQSLDHVTHVLEDLVALALRWAVKLLVIRVRRRRPRKAPLLASVELERLEYAQ